MNNEIEKIVNSAKVCAVIKCNNENVCFALAMEVERLKKELAEDQARLDAYGIIKGCKKVCESVKEAVDRETYYRAALENLREILSSNTRTMLYIDSVLQA